MFQFMRRMSASVEVVEQRHAGVREELAAAGLQELPRDIAVYSIEGPFFFGSVDSLERALSWSREPPSWLVLRLDRVPFMDATGLKRLETTIRAMRDRGVHVVLTGANLRVLRKLARAQIVRRDDPAGYFKDLATAFAYIESNRGDAPGSTVQS
jgi:sulfate permease, SulP family